jgi:hypothetical protein
MLDSSPLGKLCNPNPKQDINLWQALIISAVWDWTAMMPA